MGLPQDLHPLEYRETFLRQVAWVGTLLNHLRQRGIHDVLNLHYHEALSNPAGTAAELAAFVGPPFNSSAAAAVVTLELRCEVK